MATLTNFFKESDSKLGVFYPTHYIIATFPTFDPTKQACEQLRVAGFAEDEVMAVPASELLQYFAAFRADSGLWSSVMTVLSRSFGTEQVFADDDFKNALAGAGFLAVHCVTDETAARVKAIIAPFAPTAVHWYLSGGVQILT